MTIHWKAVEQYVAVVLFLVFKSLSILDSALWNERINLVNYSKMKDNSLLYTCSS